MTPISTIVLPGIYLSKEDRSIQPHITKINEVASRITQCPPAPKIRPIAEGQTVPDLVVRPRADKK
jgi:hypothetical protein